MFLWSADPSWRFVEIPKYIPFVDPDPAPAPRVVREINIPVVDEELRSVNEQLKLLPNARSNAKVSGDLFSTSCVNAGL